MRFSVICVIILLMIQFTEEYWPETASRIKCFPATAPPNLPVTAVKIYVFQDGKLLLTHIKTRGWDLPGGHVEMGETPEQAVVRELQEETGATVGRFKLIGYLNVTNEEQNEQNRKYPKTSCILLYKGTNLTFDAHHKFQLEATASQLVLISELPKIHHNWNTHKAQVAEYASNCLI
jgi:8-oxo-dGTP diphosphatase